MSNFNKQLKIGKIGESEIAQYLIKQGFNILPAYEVIQGQFRGPVLYSKTGDIITIPDLLVFNKKEIFWVEAKHKTAFTWHRITNRWVTGIDLDAYNSYQKIDKLMWWDVWLYFLHKGGQAKDSPKESPAGLYAESLRYLTGKENHQHENGGKRGVGMIYWWEKTLIKICDYPLEGPHE